MSRAGGLLAELKGRGTPERAEQEQRYLKSEREHYGTDVPTIRITVRQLMKGHPDMSRDELFETVEGLWDSGVHEGAMASVELLSLRLGHLGPQDIFLIEQMIRESKTWALVDPLAATVTGSIVERFPYVNETLDLWAKDDDFWIRRSALLALLVPLRRGAGDFERFGRYANDMLGEKEFFIRKAIGWVLRETSKKRPELVFEWLGPRTKRASGVTMREAVRYLSEDQRIELGL